MELLVKNLNGEEVSKIDASDFVFGAEINESVIARVVHWQRSKSRNQVQTIKDRSQVKMTGKKAYRQKGTGSARRGPKSTCIMRGGGAAHAISHVAHDYTLPKKVRRLGLRSALSLKAKEGKLVILDRCTLESHKTALFVAVMNKLNVTSALIVSNNDANNNLMLASRNLYKFVSMPEVGINVLDVLSKDTLIMDVDAIKNISERLLQDAKDKT